MHMQSNLDVGRPGLAAVNLLSDDEVEDRLKRLAAIERQALAALLLHLGEFDRRGLHADRGQPSLFYYCTRVLGYSEQAAYKRIQAARTAREHPEIIRLLANGELHLTAAVILAPHLNADTAGKLLAAARGKRTRELEILAAELAPRPDTPDCLRAVPMTGTNKPADPVENGAPSSLPSPEPPPSNGIAPNRNPAAADTRPEPRPVIGALSKERFLFRFTGSAELRSKYERAKELLGLGAAMETVLEKGLDVLLDKIDPARRLERREMRRRRPDRQKPAQATRSRISLIRRDAVWKRNGGRCTFTAPGGSRCPATSDLEIDHIHPRALGGSSDESNLRLLCRAHNQLLARRVFGDRAKAPWQDHHRKTPRSPD